LKVLVVNSFFPPRRGGSSHLSHLLAHEYQKSGHEVMVLTTEIEPQIQDFMDSGMNIVRLPCRKLSKLPGAFRFDIPFTFSVGNLIRIRHAIASFSPDVIHQHGQFFDLTWITGIFARYFKIKTVLSIHTRLEGNSRLSTKILTLLDELIVRPILHFYKPHFVIMDKLMEDYIYERYGDTTNRNVRINVGISDEWFNLVKTDRGHREPMIISSVGHVIELRNRVALVRALPGVLQVFPKVELWIVGDVYSRRFIDLANELGVFSSIKIFENQNQEFVKSVYAKSSVEAHDIEGIGFGTASIEALAAGVPVVAAISKGHFFNDVDIKNLGIIEIEPDNHTQLAEVLICALKDSDSESIDLAAVDYFRISQVGRKHLGFFKSIIDGK
jgi:glycosyltransferase involved in cell wall biosynthesis